jgi:hypothetical protein BACCOPRO_01349
MGSVQSFETPKSWGGRPGKIDAPLNKKLSEVKWGEYRLGDLFEIQNTLSFNADQLIFGSDYDYITRTSLNQGILQETGFVNKENINEAGTWSLGLLQMDFFYRRKPWYAGQFIRKIIPKFEIAESSVLFFTTLLNKQKPKLLSVLVRDVDKTFLNIVIRIPVLENGKIDFGFISSFIAELEAERIKELEAYLTVAGLKDYVLNEKEAAALASFDNVVWNKYKIGDLLEKAELGIKNKAFNKKTDLSASQDEVHTIPVTNAKFGDNGIMFWAKEDDFESTEMSIDIVQNGAIATGKVYPQPQRTGVLWDSYLIKPKDFIPTKEILFFLTTAIEKSIREKYSYEYKAYWNKVQDEYIMLPSQNGFPDYESMATFISAIQKEVIKDVVLFADRKIEASKEVVNKY